MLERQDLQGLREIKYFTEQTDHHQKLWKWKLVRENWTKRQMMNWKRKQIKTLLQCHSSSWLRDGEWQTLDSYPGVNSSTKGIRATNLYTAQRWSLVISDLLDQFYTIEIIIFFNSRLILLNLQDMKFNCEAYFEPIINPNCNIFQF